MILQTVRVFRFSYPFNRIFFHIWYFRNNFRNRLEEHVGLGLLEGRLSSQVELTSQVSQNGATLRKRFVVNVQDRNLSERSV